MGCADLVIALRTDASSWSHGLVVPDAYDNAYVDRVLACLGNATAIWSTPEVRQEGLATARYWIWFSENGKASPR